jgi:hypothetical protein
MENGKKNSNGIINNMLAFLTEYKDRYGPREISSSTIRNYVKKEYELTEIGKSDMKKAFVAIPCFLCFQWIDAIGILFNIVVMKTEGVYAVFVNTHLVILGVLDEQMK